MLAAMPGPAHVVTGSQARKLDPNWPGAEAGDGGSRPVDAPDDEAALDTDGDLFHTWPPWI